MRTVFQASLCSPVFVPGLPQVPQPLPLPCEGVNTPGGGAGQAGAEEPSSEEEPAPVEDTVREVHRLEAGGQAVEGPQLEAGGEDKALGPEAPSEEGKPGREMKI